MEQESPLTPSDPNEAPKEPPVAEPVNTNPDEGLAFSLDARTAGAWRDPTDDYVPPTTPPMTLADSDVQAWTSTLVDARVVVLRGFDTDVLYAAEHTVAGFAARNRPGLKIRCLRKRFAAPSDGKKAAGRPIAPEEDMFPPVSLLCDARVGNGPLLVIARAYGTPNARPLVDSLPNNAGELNDLTDSLARIDRFLLILTSPPDLDVTRRRTLSPFRHVADFVRPHLTRLKPDSPNLTDQIVEQYKSGLWTHELPDPRSDPALDLEFYGRFQADLEAGVLLNLIDVAEGVRREAGPNTDVRVTFIEKAGQIRKILRPCGWPKEDEFLQQAMLFVAAFLEGLTATDFDRVLRLLLAASDVQLSPVPVRGIRRSGIKTTIRNYRDVPLTDVWTKRRNQLLAACGLRALIQDGEPVINCYDPGDAHLIRRTFRSMYPFTYAEMWQRSLTAGTLFHLSLDVAQKWMTAVLERIEKDPTRFGQSFLIELLLSDEALGKFGGDFGQRFEELEEEGGLQLVLGRIAEVLRASLARQQQDRVVNALDQLIALGASRITLLLIKRLPVGSDFSLTNRLQLVQRILNQGGKEWWDDARGLLERWCTDSREGWEAIQAIVKWLPAPGASLNGPAPATAGLLMIEIVARWFSEPRSASHPLEEILRTAQRAGTAPADAIGTMIGWLLHPVVERAMNKRDTLSFFGYWLLSRTVRQATDEDKVRLREIQHWLYRATHEVIGVTLDVGVGISGREEVPPGRIFQAVALADWAAALASSEDGGALYALLLGAVNEKAPETTCRQLRSILSRLNEAGKTVRSLVSARTREAEVFQTALESLDWGIRVIRDLLDKWKAPGKRESASA